jgi:hypothetical protein
LLAKVAIKEQNCVQNAPKHVKSNIDFFPGGDTPGPLFKGVGGVERGEGREEKEDWKRRGEVVYW